MSLTRKLLESLGLESDKVSTIIEAHAETVDALKGQIDTYKADAEQLATVKKELTVAQAELETLKTSGGDWQSKYEKLDAEFGAFKDAQTAKETLASKESAYRKLLKDSGVIDKRIDSIMKVTDLNNIEIEDGAIKDADKITESIKTEWAEFIAQAETQGAQTSVPPANNNPAKYTAEDIRKMSKEEINANWEAVSASLGNN